MESIESFMLPVTYKGQDRMMGAELSTRGYLHRITIDVDGTIVFFEPDEERNYRAVLADAALRPHPDPELIRAIIDSLEQNFKN